MPQRKKKTQARRKSSTSSSTQKKASRPARNIEERKARRRFDQDYETENRQDQRPMRGGRNNRGVDRENEDQQPARRGGRASQGVRGGSYYENDDYQENMSGSGRGYRDDDDVYGDTENQGYTASGRDNDWDDRNDDEFGFSEDDDTDKKDQQRRQKQMRGMQRRRDDEGDGRREGREGRENRNQHQQRGDGRSVRAQDQWQHRGNLTRNHSTRRY